MSLDTSLDINFGTSHEPRILIAVEDDDLRRLTATGLRSSGFCVSAPTDAEAAVTLTRSFSPDIVVVDAHLTSPDNRPLFEVIGHSAEQYLMCVTGDSEHRARANALRAGADDAISTPIHVDELAARCQALLRRPRRARRREQNSPISLLVFGPMAIDLGRREARVGNEDVPTTRIEFSLLEQLCRRSTEVCTREELLEAVWGPRWVGDSHVVDVHLSNLRRKLDAAAPDIKVIHTVRGVGFRLANDVTDIAEVPAVSSVA